MNVLEILLGRMKEDREVREKLITEGAIADYAAYKALAGEIRGLSMAEKHTKDLLQSLEKADDES
jgi:ribosomal protein L17